MSIMREERERDTLVNKVICVLRKRSGIRPRGQAAWRYCCFMAYHHQGRARPSSVLEFRDTHL